MGLHVPLRFSIDQGAWEIYYAAASMSNIGYRRNTREGEFWNRNHIDLPSLTADPWRNWNELRTKIKRIAKPVKAFLRHSFVAILGVMESSTNRSEPAQADDQTPENWWECCPICGSKMFNQKCRYLCPNPQCHFFMSCSEFDR